MKLKPLVYIASPYSNGDVGANINSQLRTFHSLLEEGTVTPYAPLLNHFAHVVRPLPYETWMEYDREIIRHCDAVLRINSCMEMFDPYDYFEDYSPGADSEEEFAKVLGIPIFYNCHELLVWARGRKQ